MATPGGGGGGVTPNQLPPPYPGFSPSHSPSPHGGPGSISGVPPPSPSPQFYPPANKSMASPASATGMMMPSPSHSQASGPTSGMAGGVGGVSEAEEKQRLRFQVELEFVQCLGNPNYLNFLAQRGYFKDPAMVNYLSYLKYWSKPEYVKFIKYPVCLHFLELLQHEAFRKEIANGACAKFLDDQTILHWQSYTRKRAKLVETAANINMASVAGTPASQQNSATK